MNLGPSSIAVNFVQYTPLFTCLLICRCFREPVDKTQCFSNSRSLKQTHTFSVPVKTDFNRILTAISKNTALHKPSFRDYSLVGFKTTHRHSSSSI